MSIKQQMTLQPYEDVAFEGKDAQPHSGGGGGRGPPRARDGGLAGTADGGFVGGRTADGVGKVLKAGQARLPAGSGGNTGRLRGRPELETARHLNKQRQEQRSARTRLLDPKPEFGMFGVRSSAWPSKATSSCRRRRAAPWTPTRSSPCRSVTRMRSS